MKEHKTPANIREKARLRAERKRRDAGIPKRPDAESRFWEKIVPVTESGCWIWTGATSHSGHGQFYWKGKLSRSHRVSWEIRFGAIPGDASVLHKCDVPCCVNPEHLFLGSQADNMRDMREKGRSCAGEVNSHSKLTKEDVIHIRESAFGGAQMAATFGVSHSTICDIRAGRSWKHV